MPIDWGHVRIPLTKDSESLDRIVIALGLELLVWLFDSGREKLHQRHNGGIQSYELT